MYNNVFAYARALRSFYKNMSFDGVIHLSIELVISCVLLFYFVCEGIFCNKFSIFV